MLEHLFVTVLNDYSRLLQDAIKKQEPVSWCEGAEASEPRLQGARAV